MTPEKLQELRELFKKTTQGSWVVDEKEHCGPEGDWGVWHQESLGMVCYVGDPYPRGDNKPYENMQWIAEAHNAFEQLLDEIESLWSQDYEGSE